MLNKQDKQYIAAQINTVTAQTNAVANKVSALEADMTTVKIKVFCLEDSMRMVKDTLAEMKESIQTLQTTMDGIGKKFTTQEQEAIIENYRLGRLETWAGKAGGKLGLKFNPQA